MNTRAKAAASEANGAALFAPVQHPVLRSVDPLKVSKFLKEWDRYKDEVLEKKKEVPNMSVASLKVSVDRGLLKTMHKLGRLKEIAPNISFDELTSTHIEAYLHSLINKDGEGTVNPVVIQEALKGLRVPMKVSDPEARMLEFVHDAFQRIESVGYGNFTEKNPKKTVRLLQKYVYPHSLKSTMSEHLEFQHGLNKDVNAYVDLLCKEAVIHERLRGPAHQEQRSFQHINRGNVAAASPKELKIENGNTNEPPRRIVSQRSLLCLNPICRTKGVRHKGGVRNCPITTPEQASKLLADFTAKQRNLGTKQVKTDTTTPPSNSTIMRATFAHTVESSLCADGGSDINLLPASVCAELLARKVDMKVQVFPSKRSFQLAASDKHVYCDRAVTLDTELHIRHGKSLMIRNLKWFVAVDNVTEPLLGRPIQEVLGLNVRKVLEAACDRLGGNCNAQELLQNCAHDAGPIARVLDQGVFHADGGIEDDESDERRTELGIDTKEELDVALQSLLSCAEANGISPTGLQKLSCLLTEHRDVFNVRLGPGPPARVEPMKVQLHPNAIPFRTKVRRYHADQRQYLSQFTDVLLKFGFAKENHNAQWASAPLLVHKPGTNTFRTTFDLRVVNKATVQVAWPMPHIQSELFDFKDSRFFASVDFCAGYWQLPLDPESQHYHSFITPTGVFQPTRTLQGALNSAQNFQSRVEPCFHELRENVKAWIDDFALHAASEAMLLDTLEKFFLICREKNLKISAKKSTLFASSLRWCGYIVDKDGVQSDPRRLEALQNGYAPTNAAELSQFVHCLQWMSNFLPSFPERVAPLKQCLESAYEISGKRTSKSIRGIALSTLNWNQEHKDAFNDLTQQLRDAVKLAHRDSHKSVCIYTDASDEFWASVVTQCEQSDLNLPSSSQMHEPLAFLGGAFTSTQLNWTTFEKEAFAIFMTFEKMDYMFACESNIHLFTDHRNLLFVFNPLAMAPTLGRHIVNKVQRWALFLSRFNYTIEHVQGSDNIFADMLTRWYVGYRGQPRGARRVRALKIISDIIPSVLDADFKWPTAELIRCEQAKSEQRPTNAIEGPDGIWRIGSKIWIPDDNTDLQLKFMVAAHCGPSGHRGTDATKSSLAEGCVWTTMRADVKYFVANCLHCLVAKLGHRIPRPLSLTFHATRPNEVLHFDYLYMGPTSSELKYILVLRDDLSSYLWLHPCQVADAETAANVISRWITIFTAMDYWISDQGAHFKNSIMALLASTHHIHHHFTVAYSPWVNGSVERCMRQIREACTSLLSEFHLGPQDWPKVLDIITKTLNTAPLLRLGKRADGTLRTPLDVMTGLRPSRSFFPINACDNAEVLDIGQVRANQLISINQLQATMENMHRHVSELTTKQRKKQIKYHNSKTNIVSHRFSIGDFVLVRTPNDRAHKLHFRWTGPRVITRVLGDTVYEVKNLISSQLDIIHATRIALYRADLDESNISSKLLKHAEHLEARYEIIERLVDVGKASDGIFVQVQWLGLPEKSEWTWQPIQQLYEDIPDRLTTFLRSSKKRIAKAALSELGLRN